MAPGDHIVDFDGPAWRIAPLDIGDGLLAPAQFPEGRSHYDGQAALYLSLSPEGCVVATNRYNTAGTPDRGIFPLRVTAARVVDLRDTTATQALEIDTTHRAIEWQKMRTRGARSLTWDISDRVRALGLDGMIYASRTDPSKSHLTLFRWNCSKPSAIVTRVGEPLDPAPFATV